MQGLETATDELLDDEFWTDIAALAVGFLVAGMAQTLIEDRVPYSLPNEVYGLAVAALAVTQEVPYGPEIAMGGGMNALDAFAQRFGVQESVEGVMA